VIAGLLEVLLQALLVGLFLGEGDVGGEIRLELSLFRVGFFEPPHEFGVALIQSLCLRHIDGSFRRRGGQAGWPPLLSLSWRSTAASTVWRLRWRAS
jgi:hypothetical protein